MAVLRNMIAIIINVELKILKLELDLSYYFKKGFFWDKSMCWVSKQAEKKKKTVLPMKVTIRDILQILL